MKCDDISHSPALATIQFSLSDTSVSLKITHLAGDRMLQVSCTPIESLFNAFYFGANRQKRMLFARGEWHVAFF